MTVSQQAALSADKLTALQAAGAVRPIGRYTLFETFLFVISVSWNDLISLVIQTPTSSRKAQSKDPCSTLTLPG